MEALLETKECRSCGNKKSLDEYYRHPQMADGRLNFCKPCVRNRVLNHRAENIEAIRTYERSRGRLESRKERSREYQRNHPKAHNIASAKWARNNTDKRRAQGMVRRAIKKGVLSSAPCGKCQSTQNVQAHHDDYSKPLDVRWLCVDCHAAHHRKF